MLLEEPEIHLHPLAQAVLAEMEPEDRAAIETALSYPEETAGRLMSRDFIAVPEHMTVGDLIAEPLLIHGLGDAASQRAKAAEHAAALAHLHRRDGRDLGVVGAAIALHLDLVLAEGKLTRDPVCNGDTLRVPSAPQLIPDARRDEREARRARCQAMVAV